ncbi:MAG: hypothetical protein ACXWOX_13945 [Ktedonobacteraceae bacterium]
MRGLLRSKLLLMSIVAIIAALFLLQSVSAYGLHALHKNGGGAALNGDCTLIVPADPLTAIGLATPYQLVATNVNNGPCNEANKAQAAFVQAVIFDPATSTLSVYNPLVVDQGTQPAVAPVTPQLPQGAVVGIWFGFNGNNLTLQGTNNSLQTGNCVNGIAGSNFGQFAYCNAPAFFQAANQALQAGKLIPPPVGTARDGLPCPTVRDFSIVDQDQSDNVTTTYLVNGNGQTAQMTAANLAALQNAQPQVNASDNRLLDVGIDAALGCTPWMAPDLADPGQLATALPLNELQAAAHQAVPVALVPNRDPMVLVNNERNLDKVNAYRIGVDQPTVQNLDAADTFLYCANLFAIAPQRILLDAAQTQIRPSPDPAVANSLFTFLAQRFVFTYEANGLNCMKALGQPDPVTVQLDGNGVAIAATINGVTINTNTIDCSVNGTVLAGCSGKTTINGQPCSFLLDRNVRQVKITCSP